MNVFPGSRTPLHDGVVQEKVIWNKLTDLTFICNGRLEEMRVRGGHHGKRNHDSTELELA
jgi:hypothetical protein